MSDSGSRSRRDYAQRRAREIAYGRWQPWTDAGPVCEHVETLRKAGASYETIARAAGVSAMTVHRLARGEPARGRAVPVRIHADLAGRILGVTRNALQAASSRRDATGTRRRLQALAAMGHPVAGLARILGVPPATLWRISR